MEGDKERRNGLTRRKMGIMNVYPDGFFECQLLSSDCIVVGGGRGVDDAMFDSLSGGDHPACAWVEHCIDDIAAHRRADNLQCKLHCQHAWVIDNTEVWRSNGSYM